MRPATCSSITIASRSRPMRSRKRWSGSPRESAKNASTVCCCALCRSFPGSTVYRGEETAQEWLKGTTDGVPHREAAFEELMMLWLANANAAFRPFLELFDDEPLEQQTPYPNVTGGLREFFATKPPIGDEAANLIDMLRAPALASPDSLSGQLAFIRNKWSRIVGDAALRRLCSPLTCCRKRMSRSGCASILPMSWRSGAGAGSTDMPATLAAGWTCLILP